MKGRSDSPICVTMGSWKESSINALDQMRDVGTWLALHPRIIDKTSAWS